MDMSRDNLLAGAGLAHDENIRVAARDHFDHFPHTMDPVTAPDKIPKQFEIRDELPLLASGKIDKVTLRKAID